MTRRVCLAGHRGTEALAAIRGLRRPAAEAEPEPEAEGAEALGQEA